MVLVVRRVLTCTGRGSE